MLRTHRHLTCGGKLLCNDGNNRMMDTNKRRNNRIPRHRRKRHNCQKNSSWAYLAALLLLGASSWCIQQTTSFSSLQQQPSFVGSTTKCSLRKMKWYNTEGTSWPLLLMQSSSSESTTATTQASIKGAISDLEKHHHVQNKKHNNDNNRKKQQQSNNSSSNKSRYKRNNKKGYYYYKNKKGKHHNQQRRCSITQDKKRKVRYLYTKARSLEKRGMWREASDILTYILEIKPNDSHSYLALAKLQSRRERGGQQRSKNNVGIDSGTTNRLQDVDIPSTSSDDNDKQTSHKYQNARQIFQVGTTNCPQSIHLWHAWGMHEVSCGNIHKAKELFNVALTIDPYNGYVNHAYGMLEIQHCNNIELAIERYLKGLTYQPSAALVCSLGELYVASDRPDEARQLYTQYIPQMKNDRERIEVYLAASLLEETVYQNVERASQLLKEALASKATNGDDDDDVHDSRAYVALARLGTNGGLVNDVTVKKRLKEICIKQYNNRKGGRKKNNNNNNKQRQQTFPVKDGRLFNAWAKLESKTNLHEARKILVRGMKMYPRDYKLLQAAGNIEERLGNVTAARDLYSASLHIEPHAPTLIAYAMLELRCPSSSHGSSSHEEGDGGGEKSNITMVRKLFDEALLIDPKHGPLYNAYGNLELREGNTDKARQLYEDGINANCIDASSVYHGLAKLHLSLGEVEEARTVLQRGLSLFGTSGDKSAKSNNNSTTLHQKKHHHHHATQQRNTNVAFLSHTLAMIELKCNNNPLAAKEVLEQGLWHSRNSPQLLLAMALCESRLGNENTARAMFERSLRADQCHAQAWQAFGFMEMMAGNFHTAKTLFECGLKNSPTHGALWQAYGTLESWKGDVAKARLLFAAGIEKCPQHVPLYQSWAVLELRSGDVITAKRLIGEALTKDKRNGSGWLVAAKIEEKMNNQGLVGLILRRGIECAPGDTELYRALAEHEIGRGRIDSVSPLHYET